MHWTLDFDEDRPRTRSNDITENVVMLGHIVINVLSLDKSLFSSISVKRKELTWDGDKLFELVLAA